MANRTVKDAKTVKGTNPQYLIEKIIRTRIYESKFWKEECFALSGRPQQWPVLLAMYLTLMVESFVLCTGSFREIVNIHSTIYGTFYGILKI